MSICVGCRALCQIDDTCAQIRVPFGWVFCLQAAADFQTPIFAGRGEFLALKWRQSSTEPVCRSRRKICITRIYEVSKKSLSTSNRNILVAVVGQTPAIVLETLWALEKQQSVCVDEIRVITTARGAESIMQELLGPDGAFARYCADYEIPPGRIAFSSGQIYLLKGGDGNPLQDIRNSEDNRSAADTIFHLIRSWCRRPEEILYCSVAGGRKTMGNYLAMSLMICGRSQDRLTHVLVSPDFEGGVEGFYYPPPTETFYRRRTRHGEPPRPPLSSFDAHVELAEIPFPRLRDLLGGDLPLDEGFTAAVAYSQHILNYLQAPPLLVLHMDRGLVTLGELSFHLPRQLAAVYIFFLLAFNGPDRRAAMQELFRERLLLARLERLMDRMKLGERETYTWEHMRDETDFAARIRPCISKINKIIKTALGNNHLAKHFTIAVGRSYGVAIDDFKLLLTEGVPLEPSHLQEIV